MMAEWDWDKNNNLGLDPKNIGVNSKKKAHWVCENGHEWEVAIGSRFQNKYGCPYCSGRKVLIGYNDLATTNPSLADEWHPTKNGDFTPRDIKANSNNKVWWMCEKGHEWEATINSRNQGCGCPHCCKEKGTSFAEQTLYFYCNKITTAINRHVELGKEIDIYLPDYKVGIEYNGSYWHENKDLKDKEKIEYLCNKGIRIITVKESDKNFIDNDVIWHNYRDKETLNFVVKTLFDLIGITDYEEPNVIDDSNKILEQYIESKKENSIAIKYPKSVDEWNYEKNGKLLPTMISYSNNKSVWWKCEQGHEWKAIVGNYYKGHGCPYCSGQKPIEGVSDLATVNPELAKQWHHTKNGELKPTDVTGSSGKNVWWICNNGHEWKANISDRKNGNGCPYCSNKKVLVGYNDLKTTNPELAKEWHPIKNGKLTSKDVTSGSGKKVWWLCKCGHEWRATIASRNNYGCPKCNKKLAAKKSYTPVMCVETGKIYESINYVRDVLGVQHVWACCNGKRNTAGGYHWKYADENMRNDNKKRAVSEDARKNLSKAAKNKKPVRCIETYIIYESASQASKETGISQGSISSVCRGENTTAGGYHWELAN